MKWKLFFPILPFLLILTGCGTASGASIPSGPTTLQIERATHTINYFSPFSRTITRVQNVQAFYNAALALPKASATGRVHSCPAAFGLTYHLHFLRDGVSFQQMDMEPSGCGSLLVGKNDMRTISATFIKYFAQIVEIPPSQVVVSPLPLKEKPTP
jgi:hypothetical protein